MFNQNNQMTVSLWINGIFVKGLSITRISTVIKNKVIKETPLIREVKTTSKNKKKLKRLQNTLNFRMSVNQQELMI